MARRVVCGGRVIEELSSVLTPGVMGQHFSLDCLHSENIAKSQYVLDRYLKTVCVLLSHCLFLITVYVEFEEFLP